MTQYCILGLVILHGAHMRWPNAQLPIDVFTDEGELPEPTLTQGQTKVEYRAVGQSAP